MSLASAIGIARSALVTSQFGIQIAGNNMANAATPGYSRQVAHLRAIPGAGPFMPGRGVQIAAVNRQIDHALQKRLWHSVSDEHAAMQRTAMMDQLETVLNEMSGFDVSTELQGFFSAWSEATNLLDSGASVVETGDKLASFMKSMRKDLVRLRDQVEDQLDGHVQRANVILSEIAHINTTITRSEMGHSEAGALRDQRDELVRELSALMDVTAVEDNQGNLDILVGSTPVVLGGQSLGLDIRREVVDGVLTAKVVVAQNGTPLPVESGSIGGLLASRDGSIDRTIEKLDKLASQLIFEVNRLHSTGTNRDGLTTTSSTLQIPGTDRARPLNDPANSAFGALPFKATSGGFFVNVTDKTTGAVREVRINVDLDGIRADGTPGTADDTSAEDIRAAIDAIDGVSAVFTPDGRLKIDAEPGVSFSFSEDTSGVLAVMGVNSYFTGTNASNIGVRQDLLDEPSQLTLGRYVDGEFVENGTALEIAALQEKSLGAIGNVTLGRFWGDAVQSVAVQASNARTAGQASRLVRESLDAQRDAVSGVNIDEESINLLSYQRQFQGAARVIDIADQLLRELLAIV